MDTVKTARSGQTPSLYSYVYEQFHEHCLRFGFLHLVLKYFVPVASANSVSLCKLR